MRHDRIFRIAIAAALACAAAAASADVLYKLIDKNGKVTYSEEKPKNFDGQVIRLDIDPNANTATMPPGIGATPKRDESKTPQPPTRAEKDAKKGVPSKPTVEELRERLERAQAALKDAQDNPPEGGMLIFGNKGGGTRMVPSAAYQQTLDRLEQEVKNAEEALRLAERDL
ncbi:MAG: DUF4124 domain-containing protein [Usitatibacter sp.]